MLKLKPYATSTEPNCSNAAKTVEREFGKRPTTTEDMKTIFDDKDVTAVWVATPEHWHVPASIFACQAGKDVYVEKNLSVNIWESRKLVEAAAKYQRIVQVGLQNRSASQGFSAREYIKSGKLGKIVTVKTYFMLGGGKFTESPEQPVPAWLDWDKWLGPARRIVRLARLLSANTDAAAGNIIGITAAVCWTMKRRILLTLREWFSAIPRIRNRFTVGAATMFTAVKVKRRNFNRLFTISEISL
ncbi:MAG: Gfo/Idh/MocA family oxidoreductase [Planctomycetaceae bacterium]|jgi:hypothetical protein|nr:Gfo/Idh/MocA family oxidoreductase [Planctomycetaceae bacterium]